MTRDIPSITTRERAKLFDELKNLFHNAGQNSGFDFQDVRSGVFFYCRDYSTATLMALHQMAMVEEGLIPENKFRLVFGFRDTDLQKTFEHFLRFHRFGYITFIMFHVENCLKIILRKLTNAEVRDGYYNICKNLLDSITVNEPEKKLEVLLTPSFIRNSFHSNGIHTKNSRSNIIQDFEFTFTKGEPVNCGGWYQIYIITKEIVSILQEIFKSPEIQNISETLSVQYVPDDSN